MKTPSQKAFEAFAFSEGRDKPKLNIAVQTVFETPPEYTDKQVAMLWYAWKAGRDYGYQSAINFVAGGE